MSRSFQTSVKKWREQHNSFQDTCVYMRDHFKENLLFFHQKMTLEGLDGDLADRKWRIKMWSLAWWGGWRPVRLTYYTGFPSIPLTSQPVWYFVLLSHSGIPRGHYLDFHWCYFLPSTYCVILKKKWNYFRSWILDSSPKQKRNILLDILFPLIKALSTFPWERPLSGRGCPPIAFCCKSSHERPHSRRPGHRASKSFWFLSPSLKTATTS